MSVSVSPAATVTPAPAAPGRGVSLRRTSSNVLWNLAGVLAPIPAALYAVPRLITGLGLERYGVLVLVWALLGFFALLDLGIGRGITLILARRPAKDPAASFAVRRGLWSLLAIGVAAGLLLGLGAPWLMEWFAIPASLLVDSVASCRLLALALPFVTVSAGLRSILEAQQRFPAVTAVRLPLNLVNYLGPLAVLGFTQALLPLSAVLVGARIAAAGFYWFLAMPGLSSASAFEVDGRAVYRSVLGFAGWSAVSSFLVPMLVYGDRFLISALLTSTVVGLYVTPFEIVSRFLLIPAALVGVLFPTFTGALQGDRSGAVRIFSSSLKATTVVMFLLAAATVALGSLGIDWWLGAGFARQSGQVTRWLAIGIFWNSIAYIPSTLIQSTGRADIQAKLSMAEIPLYVAGLVILTRAFGLPGAAIAWSLRAAVDCVLQFVMAGKLMPECRRAATFAVLTTAVLSLLLVAAVVSI